MCRDIRSTSLSMVLYQPLFWQHETLGSKLSTTLVRPYVSKVWTVRSKPPGACFGPHRPVAPR